MLSPSLRRRCGQYFLRARCFGAEAGNTDPLRVCVVGTGPSGFYTAKYLLKDQPNATVDLLDKLPTPFGLVRSGVAPDHQEVKSVQNDFTQVAQDDRVSFLGNVTVGLDISLSELRGCYDAVVLAYGSEEDRRLGLDGEEDLDHVTSARAFVNWYNGHPEYRDFVPNLDATDVVIIGNGNVAVDCGRILCKTPAELSDSDIAQHAQDALARSKVERVHIVGRRGHVQSAFTTKELRELTKLEAASFVVDPEELKLGLTDATETELGAKGGRAAKRQAKILEDAAKKKRDGAKPKQLLLHFLSSPVALLPAVSDADHAPAAPAIGAVRLERNALEGAAGAQRAVGTGVTRDLPCGMLLRSIGYRSVPLDSTLPFDSKRHVVANDVGRVQGEAGLYCVGWLKRGPEGIIGTNIVDARQTVMALLADADSGALAPTTAETAEGEAPLAYVQRVIKAGTSAKGSSQLVTWGGYESINEVEVRLGVAAGKPREKLTSVAEMLAVAHGTSAS